MHSHERLLVLIFNFYLFVNFKFGSMHVCVCDILYHCITHVHTCVLVFV